MVFSLLQRESNTGTVFRGYPWDKALCLLIEGDLMQSCIPSTKTGSAECIKLQGNTNRLYQYMAEHVQSPYSKLSSAQQSDLVCDIFQE